MADKKISELDLALLINDDAEFPFSQDNAGEPTTFKGRITQLGTKIAEDMTFSNLGTTSKKLVGAINELLSLGNPIILGTSAPTSSQGVNGNLYVQYTAGTGGADDEVDGIFVKIDGVWCEISTGGGGGTTDYEDLSNKPQVNSVELVGNKSLDDLGIMPASLSKTVSGSIASFTDGADNIPVKSLVSQIVAVESGSGEKTPDNPYTISGFDNGIVSVCGVNLWNEDWELGNIDESGQPTASGYQIRTKDYVPCKPSTTYYFKSGLNIARLFYYDENKNFISLVINPSNSTFTTPNNCSYLKFRSADNVTSYDNSISINYPSTDTSYHAYNGNTYTFAFGQTVYGGYLNVTTGELTITHGIVDLGTLNWNYYQTGGKNTFNTNDVNFVPNTTSICLVYEYYPAQYISSQPDKTFTFFDRPKLSICDNDFTDANDFKTAMNGVMFVYKLATPTVIQLTPTEVKTLLGENNIFSNCGDVEVDYYTDNADEIVEVAKATASTPLHNYSTDEQIIGTWIDGSTIYEKTFDLTSVSLPNATWTTNVLGTSTSNIKIRKFSGTFNLSDGGAFVNEPYADYLYFRSTTDYFTAVLNDDGNDLNLRPQINGVTMTAGVCTIQYTKSA